MSTTNALRYLIDALDTPRFRAGQDAISFRFFVVLDVRRGTPAGPIAGERAAYDTRGG